jgi:hypothetical protein
MAKWELDSLTKPYLWAHLTSWSMSRFVDTQVKLVNLLGLPEQRPAQADRVYYDNQSLWQAILEERLRSSVTVTLQDFYLLEWFPQSPGLYYTYSGEYSRGLAMEHLLYEYPGMGPSGGGRYPGDEEAEYLHIFDPQGKGSMLNGGIGSVRFKEKMTEQGKLWFWCASSGPVAHQGFPVALPDALYQQTIDRVATLGGFRCTLVGKLQFLPAPLVYIDIVDHYQAVPQLYLLVEEIRPASTQAAQDEQLRVSVAITFQSTYEGREQMYASYVTFYPQQRHSLREASEWLQRIYVEGMYQGRIVTDFDEQMRRFSGATFSLEKLMNNQLNKKEVETWLASNYERINVDELLKRVQQVTLINTGGGAYIEGGINAGGDFINRDKF